MGWLSGKKPDVPARVTEGGSSAGRRIGKYEIIGKIGAGGFGTVYEGFDPLIQRKVAIKTCEAGTPEIRARIFQEAQLAGRLQHPNITTVYEFGLQDDVPYIVQEFLTGEDLDKCILRGDARLLPREEKLKILVGIALGLEYAHKAGVIHRDIKPSNIRLLEGNAIKIMDFGIAKSQNEVSEITKKGVAVGSAGYMSPEQICGDPVDHRTDIFSFGLLAYELVTGQKAFQADTLFKLLENVVKKEPVPIEELAPETPAPLAELVRRAIRKEPGDRFQTARELRDALVDAHETLPAESHRTSPLPADEEARRRALARFQVLDSEPEREFDDIALLAARIAGTPFALLSFVDADRQWFKSRIGLEATETPRKDAICAHTILGPEALVIPDLSSDARFSGNPFVVGKPGLRFYAGVPIVTPDGHGIGTVCVLDRVPRDLAPDQIESLEALARHAMSLLELRRRVRSDRGRSGEALLRNASGATAISTGEGK